jgi:ferredoxin
MALWGMVIDLDKCTACQACLVACKSENNVAFVGKQQADIGRVISWLKMISETEGEYPEGLCDLSEPRRDRRPNLGAMHWVPLLHGRLSLLGQVFQLAPLSDPKVDAGGV